MKWIAALLVYLSVALGIFVFHDAWWALVGFHLAILVSIWIAKPGVPIRVLFTSRNLKRTLVSVLLCSSSGLTLYFLWDTFEIARDVSTRVEEMGLNSANWVAFIAYFAVVNPLIEEYFWRGYLGSATRNLHISDFLYSGFHGLVLANKVQPITILYSLAVLVLAGWFWRQLARADGGLLAPVLGHMAADLTILLAVYWRL